jgi:hypothetical protein
MQEIRHHARIGHHWKPGGCFGSYAGLGGPLDLKARIHHRV